MVSPTAIEQGAAAPASGGEGSAGTGPDKGARARPAAAANENVVALPGRAAALRRAEREFLPAALEIIETPASPLGRVLGATLIAFFAIAVAWACLGKVDIIATAQGRIVPSGRVKVIQPLETDTVTAIHVRDGEKVAAGQVLIELDHVVSTAERNRVAFELLGARLDAARLTALRAGLDAKNFAPIGFVPPAGAPAHEVARTRAAMLAQAEQQTAKVGALDGQIAQKAAEAEEVAAVIAKLDAGLPLLEQAAEVREQVMKMQYGNVIAHLEAQLKLSEQRHELVVQQRKAAEVAAARVALEAQRAQVKAEYAQGIVGDLAEAEQKAAQLGEDLVKAEKKIDDQVLRAPIDGVVQQLAVHTIGGVVTPAQALMVVVPAGSPLEIEAMIQNKDVGFVHDNDDAEIKIDTFNFTKYGLLHGKVLNVSGDSIQRDKPPASQQNGPSKTGGSQDRTSEPAGQELVYSARVSLDRTRMQIDDRMVDLAPGMVVTVEIKTGQRRIIEFLLSPLLRYKQESLRER